MIVAMAVPGGGDLRLPGYRVRRGPPDGSTVSTVIAPKSASLIRQDFDDKHVYTFDSCWPLESLSPGAGRVGVVKGSEKHWQKACIFVHVHSHMVTVADPGGGGGLTPPSEVFFVFFCLSVYENSNGPGP